MQARVSEDKKFSGSGMEMIVVSPEVDRPVRRRLLNAAPDCAAGIHNRRRHTDSLPPR